MIRHSQEVAPLRIPIASDPIRRIWVTSRPLIALCSDGQLLNIWTGDGIGKLDLGDYARWLLLYSLLVGRWSFSFFFLTDRCSEQMESGLILSLRPTVVHIPHKPLRFQKTIATCISAMAAIMVVAWLNLTYGAANSAGVHPQTVNNSP